MLFRFFFFFLLNQRLTITDRADWLCIDKQNYLFDKNLWMELLHEMSMMELF